MFLLSFDPLPTRLPPRSAQLCSEQALVVQSGALQERLCPQKRSRPPKSSRGTLQESPPLCPRPIPASGRVPGRVAGGSIAPHPALHIPLSVSGAWRARAFRTAPRTALRAPHPRPPHSAPQPTPRPAPHPAPLSALRPAPPASGAHRRQPQPATHRLSARLLRALPAHRVLRTFPGPRQGYRSQAGPAQRRGPGSAPGLGEPALPAQLRDHRPSALRFSLEGSPLLFSTLLSRAIYYFLSLPRLIRTPAGVCCAGIPAQPGRGSPRRAAAGRV